MLRQSGVQMPSELSVVIDSHTYPDRHALELGTHWRKQMSAVPPTSRQIPVPPEPQGSPSVAVLGQP